MCMCERGRESPPPTKTHTLSHMCSLHTRRHQMYTYIYNSMLTLITVLLPYGKQHIMLGLAHRDFSCTCNTHSHPLSQTFFSSGPPYIPYLLHRLSPSHTHFLSHNPSRAKQILSQLPLPHTFHHTHAPSPQQVPLTLRLTH